MMMIHLTGLTNQSCFLITMVTNASVTLFDNERVIKNVKKGRKAQKNPFTTRPFIIADVWNQKLDILSSDKRSV